MYSKQDYVKECISQERNHPELGLTHVNAIYAAFLYPHKAHTEYHWSHWDPAFLTQQ